MNNSKESRAEVARDGNRVRLEWAADSAFRFFPIVKDEVLGYRHDPREWLIHAGDKDVTQVNAQEIRMGSSE